MFAICSYATARRMSPYFVGPEFSGISLWNSILTQRIEKLILLLKHYKLETSDDPWLLLSLRLACALVPGFRVVTKTPRGRGRPKGAKRWTREARYELIAAVEAVRAEKKGRSIANSVQILKKRDPERWASLNPARYHEARRNAHYTIRPSVFDEDRRLRINEVNAARHPAGYFRYKKISLVYFRTLLSG